MEVTTGKKWFAGTDDNVYINITGTKGSTQFNKLSNKYENNFERGKTDTFEMEAIDLGTVLLSKYCYYRNVKGNSSRLLFKKVEEMIGFVTRSLLTAKSGLSTRRYPKTR